MHQLERVNVQQESAKGLEVDDFLTVFQASSLKKLRVCRFSRATSQVKDLKVGGIDGLVK